MRLNIDQNPKMNFFFLVVLLLILFSPIVSAQPSSPHEITGEIKDSQGNTLEDISVEIRSQDEAIVSTVSDEEGNYRLKVLKDDVGEEFSIFARGELRESIDFSAFSSDNVNIKIRINDEQNQEDDTDDTTGGSGGATGGGAGGSFSQESDEQEEEINDTSENENQPSELNSTTDENNINLENDSDSGDNQSQDNQTSEDTRNLITGLFSSEPSAIGGFLSKLIDSISSFISSLF